jgi:two-component system, OmpR family, alkaline phosphatase synthesis response regulator PhoP
MSKRVLLCDDEIHILRAMEIKLKNAGYEVATAADGEEAWEAIRKCKPDLLITDCQMPRLSGLDLIHRLRSDERTADIAVFMLTAKGYELSPDLLLRQLGVLRIVAKPFSPREVLSWVDEALRNDPVEVQRPA